MDVSPQKFSKATFLLFRCLYTYKAIMKHSIPEAAVDGNVETVFVDLPEQFRYHWTMPPSKKPSSTDNQGSKQASDSHPTGKNSSSEDSVDFVQALNTALCYLCWINADSSVVDVFLRKYPEALLLEGTSVESSAHSILEQSIRRCTCEDKQCNRNRTMILTKLDRFGHYQEMHMKDLLSGSVSTPLSELKSTRVFPQLMATGRYLRGLSVEESSVQSQALELHVAKVAIQKELDDAKALAKRRNPRSLVRSLFSCSSEDKNAELQRLEFDLEMAEMKHESAQKEHTLLLQAIHQGHQKQYVLLRNAFEGCLRHACATIGQEGEMRLE